MESVSLAGIQCDYIEPDAFYRACEKWLQSTQFHHVVTLNPEMVIEAQKNPAFANALRKADIRVPDGSGLIWARWYLRSQYWNLLPSLIGFLRRPVIRVTGVDAVTRLAVMAEKEKKSIYLLGGTAFQTEHTAAFLRHRFPALTVFVGPSHAFDINGPAAILEDIQKHTPAILLVAYGAPKQTEWIEANKQRIPSVRIALGVGGAFAILSEDSPRAPVLLQKHNIEWLWRLWLQPRRLPRIWRATVQFPWLMHRQRLTAKATQSTLR